MLSFVLKFVTLPSSLAAVGTAIAAAEKLSPLLMYVSLAFSCVAALSVMLAIARVGWRSTKVREVREAVRSH